MAAGLPRPAVESTIPERFAAVVRAHPDRIAISDGGRQIAYTELLERSAGLAQALRDAHVSPGQAVPVLADQGASGVVALLGVSLAGAVFAPLDVLDPPTRARALVDLVGGRVLVTTTARLEDARAIAAATTRRLDVVDADDVANDAAPTPAATPDAPASIFFTSGSTGAPKAVLDVHRNVLHNTYRYTTLLRISSDDRLSVIQRPSFSGIASSVFGALLNGATLCTFALTGENAADLPAWVIRDRVTIFHSVPAIFRVLTTGSRAFPDVRVVRLEGDRATWDDVDRFRRCFRVGAILANGLGTTETGLASQLQVTHDTPVGSGALPVGRAAPDIDIVVLGERLEPVADGVVGEVAVRSCFLARGYLGAPELTAERFLPDRDGDGRRVYLTGDLGRIGEGGELEVLGRRDGAVKVGGTRVEPAEVEAALLTLAIVRDARVATESRRSRGGSLAALVVPASETTVDEIRTQLARSLPTNMIPARIELVTELPLDAHWKQRGADGDPVPPMTDLEAALTAIWAEILETDVGPDDLFVELGGDSLAAAEISAAVESRLGCEVPYSLLSRTPTVALLAAALEARDRGVGTRVVVLTGETEGTPLVMVPDHRGEPLMFAELARRLDVHGPVWGLALTARPTDDLSIPGVADHVVATLRASLPHGPYRLCGFCYGAVLTIEVARRLRRDGADVCVILLGLFPTDLDGLVSPDALERWLTAHGRTPFSLSRVRYHVRRARRQSRADLAGYARSTARRAVAHLTGRARPVAAGTLQAGARGFRPAPLPGHAHLVLAEDTVVEYAADPAAAWAGVADEVDVRLVPGAWTDNQLLRLPGSIALATSLGELLQTEP